MIPVAPRVRGKGGERRAKSVRGFRRETLSSGWPCGPLALIYWGIRCGNSDQPHKLKPSAFPFPFGFDLLGHPYALIYARADVIRRTDKVARMNE